MRGFSSITASGALVLALSVGHGAAAGVPRAAASDEEREIPTLEVVQRLRLPGGLSPARDIRWVDRDSVLVLRVYDGVTEHALREGMPVLRRVLPGANQYDEIGGQACLATAEEVVLASGPAQYVWTGGAHSRGQKGSEVVTFGSDGKADCDIDGRYVYVLGVASPPPKRSEAGKTLIWKGDLEAGLREFEPFLDEANPPTELREAARRQTYHNVRVGSLATSEKGKVLVYPGFRAELLLVSSGGKVKQKWDLSDLGVGPASDSDDFVPEDSLRDSAVAYSNRSSMIDDVFFVGEEPALVLQSNEGGKRSWNLVRFESEELLIQRIPFSSTPERSRVRASARSSSGEVAFLVGDFGLRSEEASDEQEVLIVRLAR